MSCRFGIELDSVPKSIRVQTGSTSSRSRGLDGRDTRKQRERTKKVIAEKNKKKGAEQGIEPWTSPK